MTLDPFEQELEDAIRQGLREAGIKGVLAHTSACVRGRVLQRLKNPSKSTAEIAATIREQGGFVRTTGGAMVGDEFISNDRLVDALLHAWREDAG